MTKTRAKKQIETMFGLVKKQGLSPMWTHYKRPDGSLGATTCVLLNEYNIPMSRGATVVSEEDNPDKTVGRAISLKRAFAGYISDHTKELYEELYAESICDKVEGLPPIIPKADRLGAGTEQLLTPTEQWRIRKRRGRKS